MKKNKNLNRGTTEDVDSHTQLKQTVPGSSKTEQRSHVSGQDISSSQRQQKSAQRQHAAEQNKPEHNKWSKDSDYKK